MYETLNCIVKPINLEKKCTPKSCKIVTPFGAMNSSDGYFSHNHATIVWEPSWTSVNKAENRKIESGSGRLYKEANNRYFEKLYLYNF